MNVLSVNEPQSIGYDTLQEIQQYTTGEILDAEKIDPYVIDPSHLKYLENDWYHHYLKMHKVTLGQSGYEELYEIGEALEGAYMPRYIDAAAWSFAEVSIFDRTRTQEERRALLVRAEDLWVTALEREVQLETTEYSAVFDEVDTPYRIATAIAFTPLIGALINGDIASEVREKVLADVAAIAQNAANDMTRAVDNGFRSQISAYSGLLHESNALSALLYNDDPRYVPLPATARADSGYYHRGQTHDISIINQHWGTVKKVLPVEIKASPSRRDKKRYKALVIRGKMHLTPDGVDPRKTTQAFYNYSQGTADLSEVLVVERLSHDVRTMLSLYQKGGTPEGVATGGLTRFYDTKTVASVYPGLAI
jgi:hypothetical protein